MPSPGDALDVSAFQALVRTAGLLSEDHSEAEFGASLEALLDRLDLLLSQ